MSDTGWNRFNTDAHRTAQAACVCIIACAVDGATRRQVCEQLTYSRAIGDMAVVPILLAQLTGHCCIPPGPALPGDTNAGT